MSEPAPHPADAPNAPSPYLRYAPGMDEPIDDETFAFIQAIERFKVERNRAFPSWSDVLSVVKSLGYEKRHQPPAPPRT